VREKETQRRNDAVHGRDPYARLALFDLELPEFFYRRSIGGRPRYVANLATCRT
jgi:hypothetical protein